MPIEEEYFRQLSEYKFAVDLQSKIVDARRAGVLDGVRLVAKKMLKRNKPIDEIIKDTGLTREEIEGLNIEIEVTPSGSAARGMR